MKNHGIGFVPTVRKPCYRKRELQLAPLAFVTKQEKDSEKDL